MSDTSQIYVGRQPVLDGKMQVFAYEVQFSPKGTHKADEKSLAAIKDFMQKLEADIGFQAVVGRHKAILRVPEELTHPDHYPAMENTMLMVQVSNDILKNIQVLRNLKEAKVRGFNIVLHGYQGGESDNKLANVSDFVKVDVSAISEIELKQIIEYFADKHQKLIADKVETQEQYEYLIKLGFEYCQGNFFTNPSMINGTKLTGNKLTLLQLMTKVNDPTTDFDVLSDIISQDVGLSHKLLVAINNPANLIPVRVESIAEAIKFMGLKRLKFWVNLLLLSGMEEASQELLINSLLRAKFCELIAESIGHSADKDSFFLVGLLSNLGAFFRVPLAEIIQEMPLSDELINALIDRQGDMGLCLNLYEEHEKGADYVLPTALQNLSMNQFNQSFIAASAWAQKVISE